MAGRSTRSADSPRLMHHGAFVQPWTLKAVGQNVEPLLASYRSLLALIQDVPARASQISADVELSDVGRTTRRQALADIAAPAIVQARAAMADAAAEMKRLQSAMSKTGIDKTDVAGAIVRSDVRRWLRDMPDAKRNGLIGLGLEPDIAAAIIEAPAALSGVTDGQVASIRDSVAVALSPAEARAAQELGEAMESVASAEKAMVAVVLKEAGMTQADLDLRMGGPSPSERAMQRFLADHGEDSERVTQ